MNLNVWQGLPDSAKKLILISSILFTIFLIVIFVSFAYFPFQLTVTQNNFDLYPTFSYPMKIVFIADIQGAQNYGDFLDRAVEKVNEQEPDLILIGGDFVQGFDKEWEELDSLGKLEAKYGVFGILGNHDYPTLHALGSCDKNVYDTSYAQKVEEKLESLGIEILRNENRILEIDGKEFALVGVDDVWACQHNYSKATQNLSSEIPKIILIHEQEGLNLNELEGRNLILAGHTHCGQVRLPIIGSIPKLLGFKGDVDMGYKKFDENNEIYVTCGVTPGRIRFLTNPEISVLNID